MTQAALYIGIVVFHVALALPPAIARRSAVRFGFALVLVFMGVSLPLFVYAASSFLVPDWKGGCHFGWLDCFMFGKLALAPLVLWATSALYVTDIWEVADPKRWWINIGFAMGAITSSVCFVFGIVILTPEIREAGFMAFFLFVPLYVCVWHTVRTIQSFRSSALTPADGFKAVAGSFPFWICSIVWSRSIYVGLPDSPPSCFVVTAATKGHARLVGPHIAAHRRGQHRLITRQLATFWSFEQAWIDRAPKTHAAFRHAYNRVGPSVASQVRSVWIADLVYLLLLPAELVAVCILKFAIKTHENTNR